MPFEKDGDTNGPRPTKAGAGVMLLIAALAGSMWRVTGPPTPAHRASADFSHSVRYGLAVSRLQHAADRRTGRTGADARSVSLNAALLRIK